MNKKITKYLPYLLLLLLGFISYFNMLGNDFVWDDMEQIVKNNLIKSGDFIWNSFLGSTFNSGGSKLAGIYYKPLMSVVFGLNHFFWGLNPIPYHIFQLAFHILNGLLVFALLKKHLNYFLSFSLAAVFIVHPINTEAVSYIASTQEVLFTFFILLSLLLIKNQRLVFFSILGALLSKESGIMVIPLTLLMGLRFSIPLLAFIVYLFLRFGVAKVAIGLFHIAPIAKATLIERLITMPKELYYYLVTYIFPKELSISQHWIVKNIDFNNFWLPLTFVLSFILAILFLNIKLKSKSFFFFTLWFFGSLVIVSNIFPLDMTVAERWFYFPQIGLLGMTGIVLSKIWKKHFTYLFIIIITIFSIRTISRNNEWKNSLVLFQHDIGISKNSFDLENNLGTALFRLNRLEEAKIHFQKSAALAPDWWIPYNNLGSYYEKKGNNKQAEIYFRKSMALADYYLAYENLSFLLLKQKKYEEIISLLKEKIQYFSSNPRILMSLSISYNETKEPEKALYFARLLY